MIKRVDRKYYETLHSLRVITDEQFEEIKRLIRDCERESDRDVELKLQFQVRKTILKVYEYDSTTRRYNLCAEFTLSNMTDENVALLTAVCR